MGGGLGFVPGTEESSERRPFPCTVGLQYPQPWENRTGAGSLCKTNRIDMRRVTMLKIGGAFPSWRELPAKSAVLY